MGGVRESEDWTIRVDAGEYDPVLGDSYQSFARLGLSFQRSQNSGRFSPQPGPSVSYYKRLQSLVDAPREGDDVLRRHRYHRARSLSRAAQDGAGRRRGAADGHRPGNPGGGRTRSSSTDPSAAAPALARALAATRRARERSPAPIRTSRSARSEGAADRRRDSRRARHQPDGDRAAGRHAGGDRAVQCRPAGDAGGRSWTDLRGSHGVRESRPVEVETRLRVESTGKATIEWAIGGAAAAPSRPGDAPNRPIVTNVHRHRSGERAAHAPVFLPALDPGRALHDR